MKIKHARIILTTGAIMSALSTGCYSAKHTYQDAPPAPLQFDSMKAEQTFYNAVLAKYFPAFDSSTWDVEAQMSPIEYDNEVRKSSNVLFNEEVAVADANHDGIITQSEADAYAAAIAARTDKQKKKDAT